MSRRFRPALMLFAPLFLAACGGDAPSGPPSLAGNAPQAVGLASPMKPDKVDKAGVGVNAYLWRGALDTLSFMPLVSADPFGGVIITDWWQPPSAPDERFKATAYVLGRELRADGIRVSIFRQVRGPDGQWTNAAVNPETTGEIENKVLARARELRAEGIKS
jgi:hypothetical protein